MSTGPAPVYNGGMLVASGLQFFIWLVDSDPPIWRRFQVSNQLTLDQFHQVVQVVMGWQNSHLYEFVIGGDRYSRLDSAPLPDTQDAGRIQLAALPLNKGETFIYTYDLGDGWLHRVGLERSLTPDDITQLPICLEGERACPPENSGGIWGYNEILERLSDPEDPEYEDLIEWVGGDFDPERFDLKAINQQLQQRA